MTKHIELRKAVEMVLDGIVNGKMSSMYSPTHRVEVEVNNKFRWIIYTDITGDIAIDYETTLTSPRKITKMLEMGRSKLFNKLVKHLYARHLNRYFNY